MTSRTLLGNFCTRQLKTYKTKPVCLLFKQWILEYLWLVFDISNDIKMSYFYRTLGNSKTQNDTELSFQMQV